MKLTDTQLGLLSAASQREDCGIELTANLTGGAAQKLRLQAPTAVNFENYTKTIQTDKLQHVVLGHRLVTVRETAQAAAGSRTSKR